MSEEAAVTKQHVGKPCIYVDTLGQRHAGLITAVWGARSCNLVYVNTEEGQEDSYGQKIARATSCPHRSAQTAPGNYFMLPEEA